MVKPCPKELKCDVEVGFYSDLFCIYKDLLLQLVDFILLGILVIVHAEMFYLPFVRNQAWLLSHCFSQLCKSLRQ